METGLDRIIRSVLTETEPPVVTPRIKIGEFAAPVTTRGVVAVASNRGPDLATDNPVVNVRAITVPRIRKVEGSEPG